MAGADTRGLDSAAAMSCQDGSGDSRWRSSKGAGNSRSDSPPVCCNKPMESRFARAHDRLGQTVFVAVWHCPDCGRSVK